MSQNDTSGPRGLGLAFDPGREPAVPRDAATVVLVREGEAGGPIELYSVVRHAKSGFLGGAVVFPGGKIDEADQAPVWAEGAEALDARAAAVASSPAFARALVVGAARETLEEAGVLPLSGAVPAETIAKMRASLVAGRVLFDVLAEHDAALDFRAFVPFARWVTPEAEPRRFDARFYLVRLPPGQEAANDGHETTAGFWASPDVVLDRFVSGQIQLAPPTTRCLELLRSARSFDDAVAIARAQSLQPICPRFVPGDPPLLSLPGDPTHEIAEKRVDGPTRFVLRDGKFLSEDPPPSAR